MLDGVGSSSPAEAAQGFQPAGKRARSPVAAASARAIAPAGTVRGGDPSAGPARQTPATRRRLRDLLAEGPFRRCSWRAARRPPRPSIYLVNGSPAGMTGFDELPLPQALLDTLDSTTHVAICHRPVMTPLLTHRRRTWLQSTDRAR